jgi:hypothetical protein
MVDSFNIDDISLSNQFPFASNEDVIEVNRTPIAKKRWARSANYSIEKDVIGTKTDEFGANGYK